MKSLVFTTHIWKSFSFYHTRLSQPWFFIGRVLKKEKRALIFARLRCCSGIWQPFYTILVSSYFALFNQYKKYGKILTLKNCGVWRWPPPLFNTYYKTFHSWLNFLTPKKECDTKIPHGHWSWEKAAFIKCYWVSKRREEIIKTKKTKTKTKMWRSVTKWFLSAAEFQWRREEIGIGLEEHFSQNSIILIVFDYFRLLYLWYHFILFWAGAKFLNTSEFIWVIQTFISRHQSL